MRRRLQILAWTLIWSGVFVFGYLGWQLFGTDLLTRGAQAAAQTDLEETIDASTPTVETVDLSGLIEQLPPGAPESVEFTAETAPGTGEPFAFLRIPKIGADHVVFEGVDVETLKSGPGHMAGTPVPGQSGNSVISGHRTTYGRPFFDFDLLVAGDRIEVESLAGTHVYEVREILLVKPTDVWVTDPLPGGWLTLTTCHPKFSARERLVIRAELIEGPNFSYIQVHASGLLP
ncbi:MAG TPA: sortase [Acidimicrobiia bacterium]